MEPSEPSKPTERSQALAAFLRAQRELARLACSLECGTIAEQVDRARQLLQSLEYNGDFLNMTAGEPFDRELPELLDELRRLPV